MYDPFFRLNKEKKEPDPYITSHPIITKQCLNQYEIKQRALLVALGLVYYMRLNTHYRKVFVNELEKLIPNCNVKFKEAFNDEVCTNVAIIPYIGKLWWGKFWQIQAQYLAIKMLMRGTMTNWQVKTLVNL